MTTMIEKIFWAFMPVTEIRVTENERAFALRNGRFVSILEPGLHRFMSLGATYTFESNEIARGFVTASLGDALVRERPDIAARHFVQVRPGGDEVAVILRDGRPYTLTLPDTRLILWKDAGPWTIEMHDVSEPRVPRSLARRIEGIAGSAMRVFVVDDGQAGLLYVDGERIGVLEPGRHAFWMVGRSVDVKRIDMRRQVLDVAGQEVLTKDRVTIRVNLAAEYRVVDVIKAVETVKDFSAALYSAIQLAFRKTLATRSLDQLLTEKGTVDREAAEAVQSEMAEIGIEVGDISIKDVILPGEMREILNRVVLAEKEAEANVIRRREETAATRSLLNTARVMEENPVMLRLKELEALERLAERVGSLTVHSGTRGLLDDLIQLSPRSKPE